VFLAASLATGEIQVRPPRHTRPVAEWQQDARLIAARGATIVQVHAMATFAMTYDNPADTPHH
jgi:hypothetical protein